MVSAAHTGRWYEERGWTRQFRFKPRVMFANRGKLIVRPEGVLAYNWHRGDAVDPTRQVRELSVAAGRQARWNGPPPRVEAVSV